MLKDDAKGQGQAECARMRVCALQSVAAAGPSRAILGVAMTAYCVWPCIGIHTLLAYLYAEWLVSRDCPLGRHVLAYMYANEWRLHTCMRARDRYLHTCMHTFASLQAAR